jgi:putative ABC transport system permease protein
MKQIYYVIQTLLRGRGSNIIKIISLGLSLTMSILLFSRVAYEQSFDTCYKDYDNLYQIWSVFTVKGEKYPPQEQNCGPVAGAILENFPEQVEAATSTCYWKNSPLYNGNIRFDEKKIVADSLFFQTMGIEVLSGNPVKDLQQPDVIFLSDRFAKKIFGGEDPVGKTINYNHEKDFMVKGTYKALPANATVNPEAVISMPTLWNEGSGGNYSWQGGDSYPEYIRFRSGADKSVVNARIDAMIEKYRPEESKTIYGYTAFVKPIRDTYRNYESVKRMRNIMSVLGFAILFIAALNYVLISISSLTYRAKAVGVHKCNGASGGKIFGMFLLETGIIIVAALLLMALVLLNFREFFEDTAAAKLSLLLAPERIWVPLTVIGVLFIVGGVLPGRLFARIPVSQVFRRYTEGKKGWKRPLLFIQFAGVAFISGLMCVVMAQYQYVLNKDMGYNPQRLALANAYWNKEKECDAAFQFFKGLPYVEAVTSANNTPISGYSGSMIRDESGNALFSTRACYYMREDYPAMMGMTFKTGRMARTEDEVIVNETFADMMHWGNDAVGRTVDVDGTAQMKVVGVLKDFQIEDFTADKMPFVARYNKYFVGTIHVRLKEPFVRNLQQLNKDVADAFHNQTIDFIGYEKKITDSYNSVRVFRNATLMAAITMFFVMLMGLIGYTADEVRRRSKEIAIRKVNGAEASSILELLSKDILVVALPAVILGSLASWYINGVWMEQFAEQIPLGWIVYLLVIIVNLVIIVGCVLWKSWRIANENPVNSIKSE